MMSSKKARKWLFTLLPLFALYAVKAKNPTAVCHYVSFYNPQQSSYIETYVTFIGNTFNFEKKAKDIYFSKAELTINLYQKDSLITGSKTIISSTPIADTAKVDNFIDVQRFALANGFYTIEYQVKDALDKNSKTITVQDTFSIHYTKQEVAFSGIELLEKYTPTVQVNILSKSGYDLVPYVADFYPENFNRLIYYAEIYNTNQRLDSTETLIQKATITSYETGAHLSNYSRFSKHKPKLVIVCLNEFNIAELPTGNYYLLIELINKNNIVLVSQKVFFQRLNPKFQTTIEDLSTIKTQQTFVESIQNTDTLREYIRCLRPIANQLEENFITKETNKADTETLQRFFLSFWKKRNIVSPEGAWLVYKDKVNYVNSIYKTSIKKGYATDRGRVYLKYGAPDQMVRMDNEPSSYPYEIWQYYHMAQRNNRKFVFYNPDLVTNDYRLLHSDAIGEIRNDSWQVQLVKRNNAINNLDTERPEDHYGSKVQDMYSNPR